MLLSFDYQALFSLIKNQSNVTKPKKRGSSNSNFRQLFLRVFKHKRTGTIYKLDKYSETNRMVIEDVTGKTSDSKVNNQTNADYFDMLAYQMFKDVEYKTPVPDHLNYGVVSKQFFEDENEEMEFSVRNGESLKICHEESTSKDIIKGISDKVSSQFMEIPSVKNYVVRSSSSAKLDKPNSHASLKSQELEDQTSYWLDATHIERDIAISNGMIEINLLPLLDQMDIFGDIIRRLVSNMARIHIKESKLDKKRSKDHTRHYKDNKDKIETLENYQNRFKFQNTESISNCSFQENGLPSDSKENIGHAGIETTVSGPYRNLEHEHRDATSKLYLLPLIPCEMEKNKFLVDQSRHDFSEYVKTNMKQLSRITVKELLNAMIKSILLDFLEHYNVMSTNKNVFFVETGAYSNLKKINKIINSSYSKLSPNNQALQGRKPNFKKESSASVSNYSLFQNDDRVYECRLECDEAPVKFHGRSLYKSEGIKKGISSEGQRSIYEAAGLTRNRYASIPSKLGVTDYDLIYNPAIRNVDRNNTYSSVSARMSQAISHEYLKRNAKYMRQIDKNSYNTEPDFQRSFEKENANINTLNISNDLLSSNSYASENFDSKIQKILETVYSEIITQQGAKNKTRFSERVQDQSNGMTSVKPTRNFSSYSPELSRVESVGFLLCKLKSRQITTRCSSDDGMELNYLREKISEPVDLNVYSDNNQSQNAKSQEIYIDESVLNEQVSLSVWESPVKTDKKLPSFDGLLNFKNSDIKYKPDSSKIRKTTLVYDSKKVTS